MRTTWGTRWSMSLIRITTEHWLRSRNWSVIYLKFVNGLVIRTDQEQCKMSLKLDNNTPKSYFSPLSSRSIKPWWGTDSAIMSSKRSLKEELKNKRKNYSKLSRENSSTCPNTVTAVELYRNLSNLSKIRMISKLNS